MKQIDRWRDVKILLFESKLGASLGCKMHQHKQAHTNKHTNTHTHIQYIHIHTNVSTSAIQCKHLFAFFFAVRIFCQNTLEFVCKKCYCTAIMYFSNCSFGAQEWVSLFFTYASHHNAYVGLFYLLFVIFSHYTIWMLNYWVDFTKTESLHSSSSSSSFYFGPIKDWHVHFPHLAEDDSTLWDDTVIYILGQ